MAYVIMPFSFFYIVDFSWIYVLPVFSFSSVKVQLNFSHEGIFEEIILLLL